MTVTLLQREGLGSTSVREDFSSPGPQTPAVSGELNWEGKDFVPSSRDRVSSLCIPTSLQDYGAFFNEDDGAVTVGIPVTTRTTTKTVEPAYGNGST